MAWKDYFYFTKGQRTGLYILITLLIIVSVATLIYPKLHHEDISLSDAQFQKEVARFRTSLKDNTPKYLKGNWAKCKYPREYTQYCYAERQNTPVHLFAFNPNELDSLGFIQLGMRPFLAHTILHYRSKGGKFRHPEDLAKIYGLSPEQFKLLLPYIQIQTQPNLAEKQTLVSLELNSADTTQLMQLKGMNRSLARRIIAYGNKLGGYVSLSQLNEVWGINVAFAENIKPALRLDLSKVKKIAVNKAGIDGLRKHPYINFYQAKAIYEFRRNKGKIHNIDELKRQDDESFSPEFWMKIEPYLDFSSSY